MYECPCPSPPAQFSQPSSLWTQELTQLLQTTGRSLKVFSIGAYCISITNSNRLLYIGRRVQRQNDRLRAAEQSGYVGGDGEYKDNMIYCRKPINTDSYIASIQRKYQNGSFWTWFPNPWTEHRDFLHMKHVARTKLLDRPKCIAWWRELEVD